MTQQAATSHQATTGQQVPMSRQSAKPTIAFIPGHWLGPWAWDEVLEHLSDAGRRTVALTLPGLDATDPERAQRTLDDQFAAIALAVEQAVRDSGEPVALVAHSGANGPVTMMLDRHPEFIARVIWVDSGPVAPGTAFAPDYPAEADGLELPRSTCSGSGPASRASAPPRLSASAHWPSSSQAACCDSPRNSRTRPGLRSRRRSCAARC